MCHALRHLPLPDDELVVGVSQGVGVAVVDVDDDNATTARPTSTGWSEGAGIKHTTTTGKLKCGPLTGFTGKNQGTKNTSFILQLL